MTRLDEAERVTEHYLDVLDKVKAAGLDAQISVKPTQLGLDLDAEQCQRNLDRICEKARAARQRAGVDRHGELSLRRSDADALSREQERYKGVGIAIQAYLYRTAKDIEC